MTRHRVHRGVIRHSEMISRNGSESSEEEVQEETEEQEEPIQLNVEVRYFFIKLVKQSIIQI